MEKYELNPQKALDYFKDKLFDTNKISDLIFNFLIEKPGIFYAFLPKGFSSEKIHEFNAGGKTKAIRREMAVFLSNFLNSDRDFVCIFDDFNQDLIHAKKTDLYKKNGLHFRDEIYYKIKNKTDVNEIYECLIQSDAIWHSLCIVTKCNFGETISQQVTAEMLELACKKAVFVMIAAYDAESYVAWELIDTANKTEADC